MANKHKTIKSFSKRFKTTKTGKVVKLKGGKNHLNAKEKGKTTRQKRNDVTIADHSAKAIKDILRK